jgi:predicted nucleotidyltransferase
MKEQRALTGEEQQALERFKTVLQSLLKDNLLTLRLFGSRARGEGTMESDLDVLVVLQKKDRELCRRIVAESLEVDLAYGINLSPTILSAEEYQRNREYQTPFYRNLERESLAL